MLIGMATNAPTQVQTPSNMHTYRIYLDDFRVTKIIQSTDSVKTEGISKYRTYRVQFGPTSFVTVQGGRVLSIDFSRGIKLIKAGAKLDIDGRMNPADGRIIARVATFQK